MFCLYFLLLALFFFFADWISFRFRGDCDLKLNTKAPFHPCKLQTGAGLKLSLDIPLENRSLKEQALVIYGDAKLIPEEKEDKARPKWVKLTLTQNPRLDGYFESTLVKPGKSVLLRLEIFFEGGEAAKRLSERETFPLEVSLSYYGRRPMATDRIRFLVPVDLFRDGGTEKEKTGPLAKVRTPLKSYVYPIPTHIILPHEDLARVILRYTKGAFNPGDWVAIAESVVAIVQGRVYPVDSIKPGFWAKRLNRFFQYDSSMASCYSMECAIREAGLPRIALAAAVGLLGKLLGRSGDFYRIAGRDVASIDDCTGTLPPYDKSVVMGPKDGNRVAMEIREKTGYEAAIVDANDLQKVDILGKSSGIVDQELIEALKDNPQGNSDEQTPIVMIKRAH